MSFEEEFDRIIRRKAEEEQYPFDEGNWDKANGMLEAERVASRAAKIKKLVLPTVITAVLGSSLLIGYNYLATDSAEQTTAIALTSAKEEVNGQEAKVLQLDPAANTNQATNSTNSTETNEQLTTFHNQEQVTRGAVAASQALPGGNAQADIVVNAVKQLPAEEKAQASSSAVTYKEAMQASSKNTPEEPALAAGKKAGDAMNESGDEQNKKEEPAPGSAGKEDETGTEKAEPELVKNRDGEQASGSSVQEEQAAVDLASAAENKLEADELNLYISSLPYELLEGEVQPSPFTYLQRYDDYYSKNPRKHYMNIEAGANYLMGWEARKGHDAEGLNWYAGINYGYYVSHKLSFGIGIQAYTISNIKQPFYLVSSKEYGFGSTPIYTRVTTNELVYVGVPLKINYAFNKTNTIGLGFNAAYLAAAKSSVSKYYLLDNEEKYIGPAVTHNKDIYEGTSMLNMMLSAHYHTRFGKRIGLNLECNYGLTDLFDNMAGIRTDEKPIGVRLGVTYTLFDK